MKEPKDNNNVKLDYQYYFSWPTVLKAWYGSDMKDREPILFVNPDQSMYWKSLKFVTWVTRRIYIRQPILFLTLINLSSNDPFN